MAPSGSVEALPLSDKLSAGRTSTVSLPALAMGGLFGASERSKEYSLAQERRISMPARKMNASSLIERTIIDFNCLNQDLQDLRIFRIEV